MFQLFAANPAVVDGKLHSEGIMADQFFSLDEARGLIPRLKQLLEQANQELAEKQLALQAANDKYERGETSVDKADSKGDIDDVRDARYDLQIAIAKLAEAQAEYIQRFHYWVTEISSTGVILRDVYAGLLDFPSRQDKLLYFLCWRMDEDDISYWHLADDGFAGRKPLSALSEYM